MLLVKQSLVEQLGSIELAVPKAFHFPVLPHLHVS